MPPREPTVQWTPIVNNEPDWFTTYLVQYHGVAAAAVAAAPVVRVEEDVDEDDDSDLDNLIDDLDDEPLDDDDEPIVFAPRPKPEPVIMFDDGSEEDHSED